nr:penicillin-binding transpeptidase domain-containing protein [Maliibacterium massiliense]
MKKRLPYLMVGITLLFIILLGRIFYLQVFQGVWLRDKAAQQWTRDLVVEPKRGDIVDRNGNVLAQNASAETVVLQPDKITDANLVADKLSAILGMDRQTVYERATKKVSEVWLKRQITDEQAAAIREERLSGVAFVEDTKRFYPRPNFLSQVLGYTSIDGVGQEGLEARYDRYLQGVEGKMVSERSRDGKDLPFGQEYYEAAQDGYTVVSTIDYVIQSYAEKAIEDGMNTTGAKKIEAIVMNPKTGEVLAMAKKPDFDNNSPDRSNIEALNELSRNTMVADVYEPGSTFKMITSCAALEEGIVTPETPFVCTGTILVDGEKIKCWRSYNPHGSEDFQHALRNSCNPVFVQLALKLGTEKLYEYITAFGYGQPTGIDFNGEVSGIVTPVKYVKNVDLARIGFGQSIAVTPIQMITAASAVVNGGNLMQPYLVKELRDSDGTTIKNFDPVVNRRVISEQTSATMRSMMQFVVDDGVVNAQIEGIKVGGKTGTAQKYDENGKIMANKHIASFIGFLPVDDPQLIVLVTVDEASVYGDTGSQIAAPVAKVIMEESYKYLQVQASQNAQTQGSQTGDVIVPNIVGLTPDQAKAEVEKVGLTWVVDGEHSTISAQVPASGARVPAASQVLGYATESAPIARYVLMPDLAGKNIDEANAMLTTLGLQMRASGTGLVSSQSIAPDTQVKVGTTVDIVLKAP